MRRVAVAQHVRSGPHPERLAVPPHVALEHHGREPGSRSPRERPPALSGPDESVADLAEGRSTRIVAGGQPLPSVPHDRTPARPPGPARGVSASHRPHGVRTPQTAPPRGFLTLSPPPLLSPCQPAVHHARPVMATRMDQFRTGGVTPPR
jgi:hypothetical protein